MKVLLILKPNVTVAAAVQAGSGHYVHSNNAAISNYADVFTTATKTTIECKIVNNFIIIFAS